MIMKRRLKKILKTKKLMTRIWIDIFMKNMIKYSKTLTT